MDPVVPLRLIKLLTYKLVEVTEVAETPPKTVVEVKVIVPATICIIEVPVTVVAEE